MTLKVLTQKDINLITDLYSEDFSDGWNSEMLLSAFKEGRFNAVGCFSEEDLVGVVTYTKGLDDADIEGIVTRSSFRNKGIATLLFDFAKEDIKKSGIEKILLEVRESNVSAISFYKKQGFKEISVRKKYYADGENALIFVKEI